MNKKEEIDENKKHEGLTVNEQEDLPYLLGQTFNSFDELHVFHLHGKGTRSSKLIGSEGYELAINNPAQGLAYVEEHYHVFSGQIEKINNKPDRILAAQQFIKDNAEKLVPICKNNLKIDDLYKAQLMLGYLAGIHVA